MGYKHLTLEQRYEIKAYLKCNKSQKFIAEQLGRGNLYQNLRHQLKHRKRPVPGKHEVIKNKKSIDLRPEIVLRNEEFGHFEVDLIIGAEHKEAILTIVERKTKSLIMRKLSSKNAKNSAQAMVEALLAYKDFVKTITSDNGLEFYEHQYISKKLEFDFYFAHPYCSWERGLNENTNGLVRQYIPKDTYF